MSFKVQLNFNLEAFVAEKSAVEDGEEKHQNGTISRNVRAHIAPTPKHAGK